MTTVLVDLKIQSREDNQLIITDEKSLSKIRALLTKKRIIITDEKKPTPKASVVDSSLHLKKTDTKVLNDGKSINSEDKLPLTNLSKNKSYTSDPRELTK